ncbi:hypothetical protein AOLI_G00009550 [Acnodon oligacanthus]
MDNITNLFLCIFCVCLYFCSYTSSEFLHIVLILVKRIYVTDSLLHSMSFQENETTVRAVRLHNDLKTALIKTMCCTNTNVQHQRVIQHHSLACSPKST